jgi:mono/diheme cytochrome c family protein
MSNVTSFTRTVILAACGAVLLAFAFSPALTTAAEKWFAPETAKLKKNPIDRDTTSIRTGTKIYRAECFPCHGAEGAGNGPKAAELSTAPADLTTKDFQSQTDGEIYWKIAQGHRPMPSFKLAYPEQDLWNAVIYIRTFAPSASSANDAEKWLAPAKASAKKNPIDSSAESVLAGKKIYEKECFFCHGKSGVGDGPKAASLSRVPGNLSTAEFKNQTDGEIYWKILQGHKPMPSFKLAYPEQDLWNVVNLIRTFAK